jgi:hypothetical protein
MFLASPFAYQSYFENGEQAQLSILKKGFGMLKP